MNLGQSSRWGGHRLVLWLANCYFSLAAGHVALLHFVLGLTRIELVVADLKALAPDSILARDSTDPSACGGTYYKGPAESRSGLRRSHSPAQCAFWPKGKSIFGTDGQ